MESIVLASELDTSANTQDGSSATGLNLDVQNVAEAKVVERPAPARITPKPFVPRMPPGLGMWSSSARSSNAPSGLGESLTIGLPPTEESQERIRKLNPGRYAFENPETARTFSNPKNVVDSFDDIENMGTFERLFKDTATSKDRGLKVLELSELGANLWQGEGYDPVSMAEIERVKREMKEIPDFGWENRDAGWVFNIPGQVAEMAPLSLHTFLSAQEAGLASGVATAGLGALAGLPAGGVGAGPGALSGFAYGYGTGTALSAVYAAGKAEAGLALIELKDLTSPDGILIPQDTAKALSLAVGTVNGLLETFALGKIVGTFPGGDKLLGQFSRGGVKQALQNPTVFGLMMRLSGAFAGSAAREGVTEGMQEGVLVTAIGAFMKASGEGFENFTHEVADLETGESVTLNGSEAFWARVFESAIAGAQGGGGMGLTGQALTETSGALGLNADRVRGAVKNLNNLSGVQKAGATLSRVMKMNKTASESTLRETNPEAYADHVKRSYPQGEIYISSEAVQRFMGNVEDPRSIQEIIASIEGLQAQIEDSAETGNDIVLSIEDYMLNVAHTPLASAISRHVRFTPEDMTAVQADAFKGSISGALEESGEAMLAELTESERAELDAKVDADQESLTESQAREDASAMIWGQLRGTYENSEASAFTEIALAQMEARADRKGLSLSQLIAQEGMPQIIGPGQELPEGATRTFDQSEYPLESRDRWYADADYKARGASLVEMTPDEFLSRTKLLEIDELTRENIDELKEKMERGEPLDPLTIYKNDLTDVRASDGRHRAIAAKELGIEIVPVLDFTSRRFEQPAFHGGPHRFDKFTTDAIGTGEGAQAFGWGLYFSSSRGIAEFYRNALSEKSGIGVRIGSGDSVKLADDRGSIMDLIETSLGLTRPQAGATYDAMRSVSRRSGLNNFGDVVSLWERLLATEELIKDSTIVESLKKDVRELKGAIEAGIELEADQGQLFQVEIPEDNELMDWDAPLSEQIPKVQEIMLDFRRTMHSDNWMEQVDGQTLNRTISAAFADPKSRIHKATGESFYRTMAEYYGGDAEVSKALSAAGIKGHKYQANQISGGPGTATNYVIYDENAIEIAKTFFQPERGSIDLSDPELRNVVIRLGEAADRSTFLHESGHLWLAQLDKDARVDGGEFAADLETIKAHMREAVGTDDVFSSEFQEQWASWTENYFMRGISPTKALRAVFKKFGAWLTKLYGAMENIPGFQGPLSPEIVEIMDRMFATQEQLKDEQVEREVSDLLVEEKDASKRAGVPAMALSEARGKAREIIENTQWRHLKPHKYRLAAAREGRLALEAAIQDDFAKSSMHKRRQVLNALLESDARRAKENGLKAANFANRLQTKRRLSRIGLAGQEYLQVILGLLNRFDLNVSRTIKEIENRKSLSEFIIERESEYDPIYISDKIRDEAFTKSWKELTIKELSELTDALKNIETIAVRQFEFNAAGQKEMQAEVRASLVDAIKKNVTGRDLRRGNARLLDKMRSIFVGAEASLAKMEAISLLFDGLDPNGAWSQKVYQPVSDSVERRNDLSAEKTEELNALMESYLKPRIEEYSKVFETPFKSRRTGKNVEMNMLEVVSLFLNIGNNGNVQRIEDGNGWKLQDVEAFVFSKMSREDYAFAKEASEIIGSLWSEIAADEARTAGIVPEKVIGRTIKTPFGDFQGAYFPIIYDPFHSMRAEDLNKKSINDGIVNPFASISGRPGAANERMRKVKDRAILFDLSVIPNHIDEIVSKVSTRDTLMQVHKLLKHEDIRRALQETTLGEEYFSLFEPWLMDIANDRVTESANIAGLNSFMKRIRLGETAGALAFRLSTLMGQPLGHSNAYGVARKMIPNYAKYHATVMSNPAFVAREAESVFEESATIRQRIKYIGREARDLSRSVDVGSMSLASKDSSTLAKKAIKGALTTEQKSKEVADFGMRLIGKLQVYAVDLPVYLAVQEAAIQELDMSPKDAQRLAEKVVRISQGGGDTKDLAAIQRGTELSKIFTVFYSYMSAVYNQAVTLGLRTVKDRGKAAILADLTFALIIPGITYDLMKAAMGGRGGPEDDADVVGYLKWLAQILVSEAMGTVPVVTLFSGAVTGQNSFGFEPSIARVVKNTGTFLGSVREGDIEDAAWESLDVLRSFMYGFPPSYPVDKIEEFLRE